MQDIEVKYNKIKVDAESSGYNINPDKEFTMELLTGLITNEERYGYMSCPCRLYAGNKEDDLDIICPCDYRDADLNDFDACFCALYVSTKVINKEKKLKSIPERRINDKCAFKTIKEKNGSTVKFPLPIWRCRVCGYLCARDNPPEVCPICKAKKDRFEIFKETL